MLVRYNDLANLHICQDGLDLLKDLFGENDTALHPKELVENLKRIRGVLGAIEAMLDFVITTKNLAVWGILAREAVNCIAPAIPLAATNELQILIGRVFYQGRFFEAQCKAYQFGRRFTADCKEFEVYKETLQDVFELVAFHTEHVLRDALARAGRLE